MVVLIAANGQALKQLGKDIPSAWPAVAE